jgi:hypothetical protein
LNEALAETMASIKLALLSLRDLKSRFMFSHHCRNFMFSVFGKAGAPT